MASPHPSKDILPVSLLNALLKETFDGNSISTSTSPLDEFKERKKQIEKLSTPKMGHTPTASAVPTHSASSSTIRQAIRQPMTDHLESEVSGGIDEEKEMEVEKKVVMSQEEEEKEKEVTMIKSFKMKSSSDQIQIPNDFVSAQGTPLTMVSKPSMSISPNFIQMNLEPESGLEDKLDLLIPPTISSPLSLESQASSVTSLPNLHLLESKLKTSLSSSGGLVESSIFPSSTTTLPITMVPSPIEVSITGTAASIIKTDRDAVQNLIKQANAVVSPNLFRYFVG